MGALAARLGVASSTVCRLETGVNHPSWELLERIAEATGGEVDADRLLGWDRVRRGGALGGRGIAAATTIGDASMITPAILAVPKRRAPRVSSTTVRIGEAFSVPRIQAFKQEVNPDDVEIRRIWENCAGSGGRQ